MYICPTCNQIFENEEDIGKHFLRCWQQHNPNHKSSSAPHSEDIIERKVNNDIINFFASLQKGIDDVGSNA